MWFSTVINKQDKRSLWILPQRYGPKWSFLKINTILFINKESFINWNLIKQHKIIKFNKLCLGIWWTVYMMFCRVTLWFSPKLKSECLSIHVALKKVLHHFLQVALSKGAVTLDCRVQNYFRLCENGQQDMMRHTRASVFNKLYILNILKKKQ